MKDDIDSGVAFYAREAGADATHGRLTQVHSDLSSALIALARSKCVCLAVAG